MISLEPSVLPLLVGTAVAIAVVVVANLAVTHARAQLLLNVVLIAVVLMVVTMALLGHHIRISIWARLSLILIDAIEIACLGLLLLPRARRRLATVLSIDPASPVHTLALVAAVALIGSWLQSQLLTDPLQQTQLSDALGPQTLVVQGLALLFTALFGAGLLVRRSAASTLGRLGYAVPTWWQVILAVAAAGAFYGLAAGFDEVTRWLTPDQARQLDSASSHVFARFQNPIGILLIALVPAISEEALFRGALQPRLGLILSALLFATFHTQYGFSIALMAVFVLALGLGLLRRYVNTTTSTICHATYNGLVGISLGGLGWWSIGIEAILVATLVITWLTYRRARETGSQGLSPPNRLTP